jgi:hypothetical protein
VKGAQGRRKGIPNVVTSTVRGIFTEFVEHNIVGAQKLYDRVAAKDPAKALDVLVRVAEFVVPKLNRTEVTPGTPVITPAPIADAAQAASIYVAVLGNPSVDLKLITFAPPEANSGAVIDAVPDRRAGP